MPIAIPGTKFPYGDVFPDHYRFFVNVTTEVKPHQVTGIHASVVIRPGVRKWAFEIEDDFNYFKTKYKDHIVD